MKKSLISNVFFKIGSSFNLSHLSLFDIDEFQKSDFELNDKKAIESDWNAIGKDLKDVLYQIDDKNK